MALRTRNVVSLCAGVGGLELGISLALRVRGEDARGICYVEREAAAASSLATSMEAGWLHPAPIWSDLLTFDARPWRGLVHILASGDPCQDNSVAGKKAGSDGERFLAPEVIRIAGECGPDLIFRENVPGNADGQLEAIVPALERLGYRVAAGIFSSAETGNTMRRERLFIMAQRIGCFEARREPAGREAEGGWPCGQLGGRSGELARATLQRPGEAGRYFGRSAERPGGAIGELVQPQGVGPGESGSEHEGQQGRCAAAGTGSAVDGPQRAERRQDGKPCRDEGRHAGEYGRREGATGLGASSEVMGCASSAEPQGQQRGQHSSHQGRHKRLSAVIPGRAVLPPAVIPGPTDSRWIDVLDRWPELQPALSKEEAESHLRRGIDAVAHRVERLRATGNGVDPVVAAYAFLSLGALHAAADAAS